MKIRTDFVTNSSSSSFVVELTVEGKNGEEYCLNTHFDPDGNEDCMANFDTDKVMNQENIVELVDYLFESISLEQFSATDIISKGSLDADMSSVGYDGELVICEKKFYINDLSNNNDLRDGIKEIIEKKGGSIVENVEESDYYVYRRGAVTDNYNTSISKKNICISFDEFIDGLFGEYDEEIDSIAFNHMINDIKYIAKTANNYAEFRKNIISDLKSVDNIKAITWRMVMNSWGEGSGCTVENDYDLWELVNAVRDSSEGDRREKIEKLQQYLSFPYKKCNDIESVNVPDEIECTKKGFVFAHLAEPEIELLTGIITEKKGNIKKTVTDKVNYVIFSPTTTQNGWFDKVWDKEHKKIEKAIELHENGCDISILTVQQLLNLLGIEYEEAYEQYKTDGWKSFPSGMAKTHWEYDWSDIASDIEGFIENCSNISDNDSGYEEVKIDMEAKTVSEKAMFTMKRE